jgi:hypothetical protein
MEIEKIDDYKKYIDFLITQYQDSEKLRGFMLNDLDYGNELENELFELRDKFWLATAEGEQLDVIGRIHDWRRMGATDSEYRSLIQIKIALNQGSGEPETIISAFTLLYGASVVQISQIGNATLQIFVDVPITSVQKQFIQRIIPAGVELNIIVYNEGVPFGFDGDAGALGFGKIIDAELELGDGTILELGDGSILELFVNESDFLDVNAGILSAGVL